jgi:hypothetical protein
MSSTEEIAAAIAIAFITRRRRRNRTQWVKRWKTELWSVCFSCEQVEDTLQLRNFLRELITLYLFRRFLCELELSVSNPQVHNKQNSTGSIPGYSKCYDGTRNCEGESERLERVVCLHCGMLFLCLLITVFLYTLLLGNSMWLIT